MARDLDIPKKHPAKDVPYNDPRGKILAADINKMIDGIEKSEPAGAVQVLRDELGDFQADLVANYNIGKL